MSATRVAQLCRGLFNMRVLAYDPYLTAEQVKARGAEQVALDDLLRESDFVSVNCPLTAETRRMMDARAFGLMKPEAYFVTTARGFIHDEAALAEALAAKRIAGAGLDVWEDEPPPPDHPLMQFDNVLLSPHTAGVTRESRAEHGAFRRRTGAGDSGRQASAAAGEPRGVARLLRPVRAHHGLHAAGLVYGLQHAAGVVFRRHRSRSAARRQERA